MTAAVNLLLVDDDAVFRETLAGQLEHAFGAARIADSARAGIREVERTEPDVVLLDLNLGDGDGLEVLNRIRELAPATEVIVVTGFGTVDVAVEAMRRGAFDFVAKPLKLEPLIATIKRACERRDLLRENEGLRRMLDRRAAPELVGGSEALASVRRFAQRAAQSDAPVLITGPSGCGKELVARAVHRDSERARKELLVVNCAGLHANLLESELFGYERGAFTGADEQRPGLLEAAHRGTLFLDEVAELPVALQANLLRAIQFGEVRRVGGVTTLKVDVRILAATNRDLDAAVKAGSFREDLYYRLNVLTVRIPPLCERPGDIEPTFRHLCSQRALDLDLGPEHFDVLRRHAWPGNVRELENLVERLTIRGARGNLSVDELRALLGPGQVAATPEIRPLADVEREAIKRAVEACGGDRKAAAEALGISPRTLYYRLASYRSEGGAAD